MKNSDLPKPLTKPFNGPLLLCVLDGVGESENTHGNAIAAANTPNLDRFYQEYPRCLVRTDGDAVGLPKGQMGNSEVGHTNLGAGRIIHQPLERIKLDMESGAFIEQDNFKQFVKKALNAPKIHLVGMVSDGGVHSHVQHLEGLVQIMDAVGKPTYIHAITDGRDTAPDAAETQMAEFSSFVNKYKNVSVADVCGRFYAMDRDNREERTEAAFNLYTKAGGHHAASAIDAIKEAYTRDEMDEFITPTALTDQGTIEHGDVVLFFNFRADRMRQIVKAFIDFGQVDITTMTEYDETFGDHVNVLYPPTQLQNTMGEVIANAGGTQLRIAETEKYAHVTFFFNGGEEKPFIGEDRIMVPSPKVRTYDLQPEMSLPELTDKLCGAIKANKYDVIICNVANGDMVGHTGNFDAAVKAMEAVDVFLGKVEAALKDVEGEAFITADHGNVEQMLDEAGNPATSHSTLPVPLFYMGRKAKLKNGRLCDIAPTMLKTLGHNQPKEMTGECLIDFS